MSERIAPADPRRTRGARAARSPAACIALSLLLAACGGPASGPALQASTDLECVPYAREVSGIALYGDAYTWWDQAAGRYGRGPTPARGAVLVFRRTGRLAHGHVSVVTGVVSGREVKVSHANWVHRRIGQDEPVVDVSAAGDWSAVRVWWAPSHALGATTYPTDGFILPGPAAQPDVLAGSPPASPSPSGKGPG